MGKKYWRILAEKEMFYVRLQGNIIGKTVAGRYMVQVGFEFDKRPMREIYKAMQLIDKKQ